MVSHYFAAALISAIALFSTPAFSHDQFTAKNDPVTNRSCCGGNDCAQVPQEMIDSGAVTPIADGFAVNLTLAQARHFNSATHEPVSEHVPWSRVLPDQSKDPNGTGYAMCIVADKVQCFFGPMSY